MFEREQGRRGVDCHLVSAGEEDEDDEELDLVVEWDAVEGLADKRQVVRDGLGEHLPRRVGALEGLRVSGVQGLRAREEGTRISVIS